MKKLALTTLAAILLAALPARADVTASDVAPPLSFCVGTSTTCVVPDFGLQTVNYDLSAKKWSGGVTAVAVGYALLFASDRPYASGVAVHVSFNFDQSSPSYFAPTFAAVLFHYFEAGYTPAFYDGQIVHRLTLGMNLNAEALMTWITGRNLGERLAARRALAN